MLNIRTLPPLAPGARMLFVGDIHGCSQEFDALVAKLNYQKGHDVLVLVGDLVNKGYDSIGVVERAIEYGAIGVLGNHDASLISKYDRIREGELDPTAYPLDSVVQTAANLPRKCYKYLTELAHIILVPQFDVVVAHAGINPKVNIPDQNLWELLHMRRVLPNGRVTDAQNGGDLWATKWKGPHTIIFGHDARTGLQIHPFAIGLDTGCCYGGDLTAYVLPSKQYVKVPGSKRGVTAKPPMASPETQIGFSPSVELPTPQPPTSSDSVMQALKAVAGSAVVQGSSSRQTPTTVVTSAPQGANSAKTEALKNMLFGKSNSPVPPPTAIDGPTFPSVPATYNSATHSPVPEPSRAPLPRSAQQQVPSAAPPTSAPTSSQSPLAKLVPSSQVVGATVERSAKKEPAATATPAPLATTAPVAPSNGQHQPTAGTNAAKPALPPALPPTLPPAPTAPSSTAASGSGLAVLRRHLFNSAVHLLTTVNGSSGVVAAATIEMLCGGPMDDHRQELLDDPTISKDKWVAFINGLSRHVTDPKCVGFVADESLLWFQDISANKPDVFDALDRKALEASIALTSSATKTVIKSTLIAVRK